MGTVASPTPSSTGGQTSSPGHCASSACARGDRVAALLVNSAAFLETMFTTAKLGAVFVPINFRLGPPEVAYLLADSGADVFVWSDHLSPLAPRARC